MSCKKCQCDSPDSIKFDPPFKTDGDYVFSPPKMSTQDAIKQKIGELYGMGQTYITEETLEDFYRFILSAFNCAETHKQDSERYYNLLDMLTFKIQKEVPFLSRSALNVAIENEVESYIAGLNSSL